MPGSHQIYKKYHGECFLRIKIARWPQQASLRVIEKGKVRDTVLSEVFLTIPGYAGTPSYDDRPVPYQWTSCLAAKPAWFESEPTSDEEPGGLSQTMHPSGTLFVQCGWLSTNTEIHSFSKTGRLNPYQPNLQDSDMSSRMEEGWLCMPPPPKMSANGVLRRSICQVSTCSVLKLFNS